MIELEKKWLVDKDKVTIPKTANKWITVQGYLSYGPGDSWIVRVRSIISSLGDLPSHPPKFFLELKSKGLLAREELRYIITEEEFNETFDKCGAIVKKTRYLWYDINKEYQYEVDFYDDHDFVTCEVEFKSMKEANEFVPPEWCIEDVTFDPKYKNMNLGV